MVLQKTILFTTLSVLLGLASAQPAYKSNSKQLWEYKVRLIKENIVCHLSTAGCFSAPAIGKFNVTSDANIILPNVKSTSWSIEHKSSKWAYSITPKYLESIPWHPTFGFYTVVVNGKNVSFHRSVGLSLNTTSYLVEGSTPGVSSVTMDLKSCFKINDKFVVVPQGSSGDYLYRKGFWFASAYCKRGKDTKPVSLTVYVSNMLNQQPTTPELFLTTKQFSSMKYYKWQKTQQVVFAIGSLQYTIHTGTCELIQTAHDQDSSQASIEQLVISSGRGSKSLVATTISLRKTDKISKLGGINQYIAFCQESFGLYLDSSHKRISGSGGIVEDVKLKALYVYVSPSTSSKLPYPPHNNGPYAKIPLDSQNKDSQSAGALAGNSYKAVVTGANGAGLPPKIPIVVPASGAVKPIVVVNDGSSLYPKVVIDAPKPAGAPAVTPVVAPKPAGAPAVTPVVAPKSAVAPIVAPVVAPIVAPVVAPKPAGTPVIAQATPVFTQITASVTADVKSQITAPVNGATKT